MTIKIFITGGTIDNLDYNSEEKSPKIHKSLIPTLLKQSRISVGYATEILMLKDSRFVTNKDRNMILQKCKKWRDPL